MNPSRDWRLAVVKEVMDALIKLRGKVAMLIVEHHGRNWSCPSSIRACVLVKRARLRFAGDASGPRGRTTDLQARLLGVVQAGADPARGSRLKSE